MCVACQLCGLIQALWFVVMSNPAADTPLTVWGTGSPLRQFLYNIDFGKLLVQFLVLLFVLCLRRCKCSGLTLLPFRCSSGRCAATIPAILLSCQPPSRTRSPSQMPPEPCTVSWMTPLCLPHDEWCLWALIASQAPGTSLSIL